VAPGTDTGINVTLEISKPTNGTHLVAGEKATVTITLKDKLGGALTKDDFATLGLYMYGPQETTKTVTAVKLLNATTDRTKTPHHYIDLLTNTGAQASGSVLKSALQPVSDELPGTYTASLRVVKKGDPPVNQAFVLTDFQLGTATVEKQIVEKEKCGACHLGADSNQFYFAHVDTSARNPYGSPSLDSVPVRTCKSCHNNEGYAAFTSPVDGTRVPDQIVRRVHSIHFGEELSNPVNTDPAKGVFRDYASVVFPANVENCAACHVDDRWKTQPSRLACGTCHDQIDWATGKSVVAGKNDHGGGPQKDDSACAACHTPDSGGPAPISAVHKVEQPMNKIDVSLTAPKNGKFYVAGEKPAVTLVIRNDNSSPIDHTTVTEANFSTASLFVYGPRLDATPVLTNAAKNENSKLRASASSSIAASGSPKAWTFAYGDTFRIAVNGGAVQDIPAPAGAQTPDQVKDWLAGRLGGGVIVTSNNASGSVTIQSTVQGANSKFEIYNSAVTTKMGWKPGPLDLVRAGKVYGQTPGTTVEPYVVVANASTPANDLRPRSDPLNYTDPAVTRTPANITYQLDDVASLKPGTYMIYTYVLPVAGKVPDYKAKTGIGFLTFQVGTETPDKKVAANCTACHGNTIWHLDEGPIHAEPFDTDYCLACHDYGRSGTGDLFSRAGGNSTSGWAGYGAKPIGARVHGVHNGLYLDHPEWVYAGNPNAFNEIIFPQDLRNCTKCHGADTTGTWKTEPSRLACLACHDSDSARAHADLNTKDPTPADPFGSDAVETCKTCHGAGKEFSPDKVHKLSNPYVPPYPREPER